MASGIDTGELAAASMPWGLCFIPAIILQWVYFARQHKKRVGTFQAVAALEEKKEQEEEKPNVRPKLFWVNLILFIVFMVALGVFGIAPYLVFIVATVVTAMINYPKNYGEIFNKVGPMYLNILVMLLAISMYSVYSYCIAASLCCDHLFCTVSDFQCHVSGVCFHRCGIWNSSGGDDCAICM